MQIYIADGGLLVLAVLLVLRLVERGRKRKGILKNAIIWSFVPIVAALILPNFQVLMSIPLLINALVILTALPMAYHIRKWEVLTIEVKAYRKAMASGVVLTQKKENKQKRPRAQ